MENCSTEFDTREYKKPTVDYDTWAKNKLEAISTFVNNKLDSYDAPTVIVLELGHFMLPVEEENLNWATQNMTFSNALCGNIIKNHKFKFKIIPTLLVNNLDSADESTSEDIIDNMLKNQKYINKKSLKTISERNLKNRAFKALKSDNGLAEQFINIDGKAYLKDDEYQHDLAAGFVNEDGDIIPRCGLILTSYLDVVASLAKQRLHQNDEVNLLFISFSEQFHEYKRVMLGVDIYGKTHQSLNIDPMIFHWDYRKDQVLLSHKSCTTNSWEDIDL